MSQNQTAFLFDLDGTLVDSVYHHVLAWQEALETEGIDTLTIGGYGGAVPTVASTQSFFMIVTDKAYQLVERELVPYTGMNPEQVTVPFASGVVTTSHWGGGPLPIWLRNDPRIRNVRSTYAMANQEIIKGVLELERASMGSNNRRCHRARTAMSIARSTGATDGATQLRRRVISTPRRAINRPG